MTRNPVAIAGAVVVLVNSIIALLVHQGYWNLDVQGLALTELIGTNTAAVVGVLFARHEVTPLNSPQDNTGAPLSSVSHP